MKRYGRSVAWCSGNDESIIHAKLVLLGSVNEKNIVPGRKQKIDKKIKKKHDWLSLARCSLSKKWSKWDKGDVLWIDWAAGVYGLEEDDKQVISLKFFENLRNGRDLKISMVNAVLSGRRSRLIRDAGERETIGPEYDGVCHADQYLGVVDRLVKCGFSKDIISMWADGYSDPEIAIKFGVDRETARQLRIKARRELFDFVE